MTTLGSFCLASGSTGGGHDGSILRIGRILGAEQRPGRYTERHTDCPRHPCRPGWRVNPASTLGILTTVQEELVASLSASGAQVYTTAPGSPAVPCWVLGLPSIDYSVDMSGMARITWPVYLLVARALEEPAWTSVLNALTDQASSALPSPGGLEFSSASRVVSGKILTIAVGGVDYAGAEFVVEILGG